MTSRCGAGVAAGDAVCARRTAAPRGGLSRHVSVSTQSPDHSVPPKTSTRPEAMQTPISTTRARLATRSVGAPDDHRLPRHEQHDGKPKQAMGHRCEPGWIWWPSKGQHTGRRGADEDDQQRHIGTATRTSQTANRAEPADHGEALSGAIGARGSLGGEPWPRLPASGRTIVGGGGGNTTYGPSNAARCSSRLIR